MKRRFGNASRPVCVKTPKGGCSSKSVLVRVKRAFITTGTGRVYTGALQYRDVTPSRKSSTAPHLTREIRVHTNAYKEKDAQRSQSCRQKSHFVCCQLVSFPTRIPGSLNLDPHDRRPHPRLCPEGDSPSRQVLGLRQGGAW